MNRFKGPPCPICNKDRTYSHKGNAAKAFKVNKPCHSCSNSIKLGGEGNVKERGCFRCGEKEIYHKSTSLCKTCHNKASRKYHKEVYRWSKYGLDAPIEMKYCEICESQKDLVIDHCHKTNKVRGVLCKTCNMGIGLLKDSLQVLKNSVNYAERTFSDTRK